GCGTNVGRANLAFSAASGSASCWPGEPIDQSASATKPTAAPPATAPRWCERTIDPSPSRARRVDAEASSLTESGFGSLQPGVGGGGSPHARLPKSDTTGG